MALLESYNELINIVSEMNEVLSIGKSGGEKLPEMIDILMNRAK